MINKSFISSVPIELGSDIILLVAENQILGIYPSVTCNDTN